MDKFKAKLEKINNKDKLTDDNKTEDEYNKVNTNDKLNISDITLVRNAFEYFDKNQEKIKNKFDKVNYISVETTDKDLEHNVMVFYDSNFKKLFDSKIEKIGIYDKVSHIWSWAWAVGYFKKNETNIIRKILFYGTELDPSSRFLKTELVTSRFKISNIVQLDMHCAIASYFSKKKYIFKYNISSYPKLVNDKYLDILNQDYTSTNDQNFELVYYHFLLDEI